VEVVIDAGGEVRTYDIVASRNGRRVEIETGRGIVTVSEVTRRGTTVRTARFMANRILALVEHPAADQNLARDVIEPQPIRSSG
jgi:predicted RecB family endonuclease